MLNLLVCAKRNGDGTFDAEVAITVYDDNAKPLASTDQRTVVTGMSNVDAAIDAAEEWVKTNLFPIVKRLPRAKP